MRARAILLALSLASILATPAANAQGETSTPAPATAGAKAKAVPEAIPQGLVGVRASELLARQRELRADLEDTSTLDQLAEELPPLLEGIEELAVELETRLAGAYGESELNAMSARWEGLRSQILEKEEVLSKRAAIQEQAIEEISLRRESWRLTRSSLGSGASRATVLKEVDASLQILKDANKRLDGARAGILVHQERLRAARTRVEDSLESLADARAKQRAQLFERQAPPIWAFRTAEAGEQNLAELRLGLENTWLDLTRYLDERGPRLLEQGLLIVLALFVVMRARRRAPPELAPDDVLSHPLAAALLLALSAGTRLHPDAPTAMGVIQTLAILPPWFVLMRAVLPPWLHRPILGLTVILVIRLTHLFLSDLAWLTQGFLIAILVVGLAGTLWLTRPARLAKIPVFAPGPWIRLLSFWTRSLVFFFGAGLGAALLGYRALAEQLSYLAVWGSFVAMVLAALVRIAIRLFEVALTTGQLDFLHLVRDHRDRALRVVTRLLRVGGLLLWAWITLHDANLTEPLIDTIGPWLGTDIGYGSLQLSVGGLLAFGATLWLFWWFSNLLAVVVEHEVFSRIEAEPGVAYATASFSRYALFTLGFVAALSMMGIPLENVTLLISALGVGIGFGLQTVVNNFVSGIILLVERPVRVGDRVQIDTLFGEVRKIGIRASLVRTFDGSDVIVPNSEFTSREVTNWTLSDRKRRIIVPVGVAYGTDPERVLELLLRIARDHADVLAYPEPEALFRGFGDSSLDFELRAFTESFRGFMPVNSDLLVAINAALAKAGIEIPFPQRDLHLRSVDAGSGAERRETVDDAPHPPTASDDEADSGQ